MGMETREIEVIICFMDHTWATDFVTIPSETPSAYLEEIAIRAAEDIMNKKNISAAYIGVYNIPEIEEVEHG